MKKEEGLALIILSLTTMPSSEPPAYKDAMAWLHPSVRFLWVATIVFLFWPFKSLIRSACTFRRLLLLFVWNLNQLSDQCYFLTSSLAIAHAHTEKYTESMGCYNSSSLAPELRTKLGNAMVMSLYSRCTTRHQSLPLDKSSHVMVSM